MFCLLNIINLLKSAEKFKTSLISEAATREVLQKKVLLKISEISQENTCLESVFNKVADHCSYAPLLKKTPTQVLQILRTSILKDICE